MRKIHEGTLDSCTPDNGVLDYASGCSGYRDTAGNVHWKNGTGSSANPRLYAVQYHRKDMAYLRPGACYFEWVADVNDPEKWSKECDCQRSCHCLCLGPSRQTDHV